MTPRSVKIEIKAYNQKKEQEQKEKIQMIWLQGAYFARALQSTPVIMGMAKGNNIPKYPDMPFKDSVANENEIDEETLKAKKMYAYNHFVQLLTKGKGIKKETNKTNKTNEKKEG